ncbi:MAG: hypothetical protein ACLVB7_01075 [Coprococcus comes]
MFYKYESTLDNDLIFWSNATADLRHNGEIGEDDLPDELLHALNELWTDGHLVSCYLVELKGRYGIALESIYDRDFAESLGITYGELVKRVEKKANYISREYPEFDTLFGKDTQSWSDGSVNSQLLIAIYRLVIYRTEKKCLHTFIGQTGVRKILNSIIAIVTRKQLLPFARTGTLVAAIGLLCVLPDGTAHGSGSSTAWFVLR